MAALTGTPSAPTPAITAPKVPAFGELAFVDPGTLFTYAPFTQYNPSKLVTKKGGLGIFDQMRQDDQVKAALKFKKLAVIASGWEVTSPDGEDEEWEVAEFVKTTLDNLRQPFDQILQNMLSMLDYGYSITEKVWDSKPEGIVLADLKPKKPHNFNFTIDPYGNLLPEGLVQNILLSLKPLPVYKFVILSNEFEYGNYYGVSDLEAAYRAWWTKDNSYKWLAQLLQRLGVPPVIAKYDVNKFSPKQVEDIKTVIKNMQGATSAAIPNADGNAIEFWTPELAGQATSVFKPALDMFNQDIARAVLMPGLLGLSPEAIQGSYARSRIHFDVFLLVVEQLRKRLEFVMQEVVKELVNYNYGEIEAYPQWKFLPITDEVRTDLLTTWASLVGSRVVSQGPDDEAYIRKSMKFPEQQGEITPADTAQSAAQGNQDGEDDQEGEDEEDIPVPKDGNYSKLYHRVLLAIQSAKGDWVQLRPMLQQIYSQELAIKNYGFDPIARVAAAKGRGREKVLEMPNHLANSLTEVTIAGLQAKLPPEKVVAEVLKLFGFDPNQLRDEWGRWTEGGGGAGGKAITEKKLKANASLVKAELRKVRSKWPGYGNSDENDIRGAADYYQSMGGSTRLNKTLSKGALLRDTFERRTIRAFDKGFTTISKDVVVYRNIPKKIFEQLVKRSGKGYIDSRYTSTSFIKYEWPYALKILVPKGTKALKLDGLGEDELVLARGTKFKIGKSFIVRDPKLAHVYPKGIPHLTLRVIK